MLGGKLTIGETIMTSSEYLTVLNELEAELCNEYKFNRSIANKIVSKADMEKHSYSEYEVEQYAYELADFVADCLQLVKEVH